MDKNLLSRFQKQIEWKSVVKIVLPAALLIWVWQREFAFFPLLCFGVALLWGYLTESQERKQFRASFWLLALVALIGIAIVSASSVLSFAVIVLFTAALAFLFGFFRFRFTNRSAIYSMFHLAFVFAIFFIFFANSLQWLSLLFLVVPLILIFREYFLIEGIPWDMRIVLTSVASGFLLTEIAVLVRSLPLGTVNAAAFLTLIALLVRDATKAHFEGRLTLASVLRGIALFLFVSVIIFGLAMWRV